MAGGLFTQLAPNIDIKLQLDLLVLIWLPFVTYRKKAAAVSWKLLGGSYPPRPIWKISCRVRTFGFLPHAAGGHGSYHFVLASNGSCPTAGDRIRDLRTLLSSDRG